MTANSKSRAPRQEGVEKIWTKTIKTAAAQDPSSSRTRAWESGSPAPVQQQPYWFWTEEARLMLRPFVAY